MNTTMFDQYGNITQKYIDSLFDSWTSTPKTKVEKREVEIGVKRIIENGDAIIIFWQDGEKTVVKCQNNEPFDPEKGIAMAYMKRVLGNKGNYFNTMKKLIKNLQDQKESELDKKKKK